MRDGHRFSTRVLSMSTSPSVTETPEYDMDKNNSKWSTNADAFAIHANCPLIFFSGMAL